MMSDALRVAMEAQLDETHTLLGGVSFQELFADDGVVFYVGATKQKIDNEAFCFRSRKKRHFNGVDKAFARI